MSDTQNTTEYAMDTKTPTLKITFELSWSAAVVAASAAGAPPDSDTHAQAIHDAIKHSNHKVRVTGATQYRVLADMASNGYRVAKIEMGD